MKIIKQGTEPRPWIGKQVTCNSCHSVYELDGHDAWRIYTTILYPGYFMMCPTCNDHRIEIFVVRERVNDFVH